ncbi:TlpA family protein disulfide reductase [bacterium]|nr:TlpA family protein disulfide reductase [bacterium]
MQLIRLAGAALFAACLSLVFATVPQRASAQFPLAGQSAPELSGHDLVAGAPAKLSDLRGKWVLLDFWATWCGPCMEKLPELISSAKPYRDEGRLAVFSLSADRPETLERLREAITAQGIDFPVLLPASEGDAAMLQNWAVSTIPATFLIDPQGRIAARDLQFERVDAVLSYFLSEQRPLLSLSASHKVLPDGAIEVKAEVKSSNGTVPADPLKLSLNLAWDEWVYGTEEGQKELVVDYVEHVEPDFALGSLSLAKDGSGSYSFTIPANAKMGAFFYGISLDLPGSEGQGSDGASPLRQWMQSEYEYLVEPVWAPDPQDEFDEMLPPDADPALAEAEDLTERPMPEERAVPRA